MKISFVSNKGSRDINEDSYLIGEKVFGVFDGASSLDKFVDNKGRTGALIASSTVKEVFELENENLRDLAIRANHKLHDEMIKNDIDVTDKVKLWCTTVAAIRINKDNFEWVQLSDSVILIIYNDGSHKTLVEGYDHDLDNLLLIKEYGDKGVLNIREKISDNVIAVRRKLNIAYGVLSGEDEFTDFLESGVEPLKGVKSIVLLTDGLFIPKEDPKEPDDFNKFVELLFESGLNGVLKFVRDLENDDPNCWKFPRFKKHDDATAICLEF